MKTKDISFIVLYIIAFIFLGLAILGSVMINSDSWRVTLTGYILIAFFVIGAVMPIFASFFYGFGKSLFFGEILGIALNNPLTWYLLINYGINIGGGGDNMGILSYIFLLVAQCFLLLIGAAIFLYYHLKKVNETSSPDSSDKFGVLKGFFIALLFFIFYIALIFLLNMFIENDEATYYLIFTVFLSFCLLFLQYIAYRKMKQIKIKRWFLIFSLTYIIFFFLGIIFYLLDGFSLF